MRVLSFLASGMEVSDEACVTASGSRQTEASGKRLEVTEWSGVYFRFLSSPWVSSTQETLAIRRSLPGWFSSEDLVLFQSVSMNKTNKS